MKQDLPKILRDELSLLKGNRILKMIFYNAGIDDDNEEIDEKLKDLDKDHERYIQEQYDKGEKFNPS